MPRSIKGRLPTDKDADNEGYVVTKMADGHTRSIHRNLVVGDMEGPPLSGEDDDLWITDRRATKDDGDKFGRILLCFDDGSQTDSLWNDVGSSVAWQPLPKPYVAPAPPKPKMRDMTGVELLGRILRAKDGGGGPFIFTSWAMWADDPDFNKKHCGMTIKDGREIGTYPLQVPSE